MSFPCKQHPVLPSRARRSSQNLNADERKVQLLAEFDRVIAVLNLIHHTLKLAECFDDALPVYDARPNEVIQLKKRSRLSTQLKETLTNLENNEAVLEVRVEPIDVWIAAQTVHPVSIRFFLSRLLERFHFRCKIA